MPSWVRVDSNRQGHPKFCRGGPWVGVVVEAAWEISKSFGLGGHLGRRYWDAVFLATWTHFDRLKEGAKWMTEGMTGAVEVGLVEEDGESGVIVHDWDQYQRDEILREKNRTRQAKYRALKTGVTRDVTATCHMSQEVTPIQDMTGHDRTEQNAKRGTSAPDVGQGELFHEQRNPPSESPGTAPQSAKRVKTKTRKDPEEGPPRPPDPSTVLRLAAQELLSYYSAQVVARGGEPPVLTRGGADLSSAKVILRSRSLERAKELVDLYLDDTDQWVVERGHPFGLLPRQVSRLERRSSVGPGIKGILSPEQEAEWNRLGESSCLPKAMTASGSAKPRSASERGSKA